MSPARLSKRSEAIRNVNHVVTTKLIADGNRSANVLMPKIRCESQIVHIATGGLCNQMWFSPHPL